MSKKINPSKKVLQKTPKNIKEEGKSATETITEYNEEAQKTVCGKETHASLKPKCENQVHQNLCEALANNKEEVDRNNEEQITLRRNNKHKNTTEKIMVVM